MFAQIFVRRGEMCLWGWAMKRMAWVMLLLGVAGLGSGLGSAQTLSADEIVRRVMQHDAARREALIRYGSERTYEMDYKGPIGTRHAKMQVRMDYSAPESKKFTSTLR